MMVFVEIEFVCSVNIESIVVGKLLLFLQIIFCYIPDVITSLNICILSFSGIEIIIIHVLVKCILEYRLKTFERFQNRFHENTRIIIRLFPFIC